MSIPSNGVYIRASQRSIYYSQPSDFSITLSKSTGIVDEVRQLKNFEGDFPVTEKQGYYIDSTGAEVAYTIYDIYIVSVFPGGLVYGICGNAANGNSYLAFYDKQGNIIGEPFRNTASGTYLFDFSLNVPSNASILKISHRNNVNIDFSVSLGNAIGSLIELNNKIPDGLTEQPTNYTEIFHTVGIIGDSLASGEIAYQSGGQNVFVDKYDYSWLSNICRNCGTTPKHYSKGGMMAKTWLEDAGGMKTAFENDTACNAYFIALGTNDRGHGETLGDITDASGVDSFVGYMKEIIGLVHTKAPNAVIFLVSMYSNSSLDQPWSEMIEAIAGLYDYCYYVDFVGNTSIYTTSGSPYTSLNHFTTPAYVEVGKTIQKLVNEIVYNNYSDFMLFAVNN